MYFNFVRSISANGTLNLSGESFKCRRNEGGMSEFLYEIV